MNERNGLYGPPSDFRSIVVNQQKFSSSFKEDLEAELRTQSVTTNLIVFTSVATTNASKIVKNIVNDHARLKYRDQTTVLISCYQKHSLMTQLKSIWFRSSLEKINVSVLPPLSKLTTDDLFTWVNEQKTFVRNLYNFETLQSEFWKLLPKGVQKHYVDIQGEVVKKLIQNRVS